MHLSLRFRTKQCFVLVCGEGASLLSFHKADGTPEALFATAHDEEAENAIITLVNRNPQIPLRLYADTSGQDFCVESFPPLGFLDRSKLLSRRLQQAFGDRDANHYRVMNNSEVLLAGLSSGSPALRWQKHFLERTPDIGLLAIESAGLALRLMPAAAKEWLLLLVRTRTGGLRQIVLREGKLIFSRLIPDNDTITPASISKTIKASLSYLVRHGLKDSRALRVVLLVPEACTEEFDLPVHSVTVVSPAEAAQQLNIATTLDGDDLCSDALLARWLAKQPHFVLPLLPREMREAKQTESIRYIGMRAAIVLLILALSLTIWQATGLISTLHTNYKSRNALENIQQQIVREQTLAEPLSMPLGKLRAAVERRRMFSESGLKPWPLLSELNAGLGDTARLMKLDWRGNDKQANETLSINVRLINAPSNPDNEALVASFRKAAANMASAAPDYVMDVVHYPVAALPQESLTKSSEKDTPSSSIVTAQFSLRKGKP